MLHFAAILEKNVNNSHKHTCTFMYNLYTYLGFNYFKLHLCGYKILITVRIFTYRIQ